MNSRHLSTIILLDEERILLPYSSNSERLKSTKTLYVCVSELYSRKLLCSEVNVSLLANLCPLILPICFLRAVDFENAYNDVREETIFSCFINVAHAVDPMTTYFPGWHKLWVSAPKGQRVQKEGVWVDYRLGSNCISNRGSSPYG